MLRFRVSTKGPNHLHSTRYGLCSRRSPYGLSRHFLCHYSGPFEIPGKAVPMRLNKMLVAGHLEGQEDFISRLIMKIY